MPESGNFYISISNSKVIENQQIGYIDNGKDTIIRFFSHLSGKISFNCLNGDFLKQEDVIFSIIPDSINQIYGTVFISSDKINKISINQDVILISNKINIVVKGYVSKIYSTEISNNITNNSSYKVELIFTNYPLNSNIFEIGTIDNVKILISEKSLLKRIFR